MKIRILFHCFAAVILAMAFSPSNAQVNVTINQTALQLASMLTGSGVTVTNPVLTCQTGGSGIFNGVSNLGIDSGIVLTSGKAKTASPTIGVNASAALLADNNSTGTAGDPALNAITGSTTKDACILEFDVVPQGDTLRFDYVFGSEEFTDWTCSQYNDAFGFLISGTGFPTTTNIALLPNTNTPVTINNLHCTAAPYGASNAYYITNTGTTIVYDGFSKVLTAIAQVTPCSTYHLKLAIADVVDDLLDSGVFLRKGSLSSPTITTVSVGGSVNNINSLTQPEPYVVRGCLNGKFTFTRPQAKPTPQKVKFQIVGTAVNGADYVLLPDSVEIPSNATSVTASLVPLVNGPATGPKTVKLRIFSTNVCNANVVVDSAILTIRDSLYVNFTTADAILCKGQSVTVQATSDPLLSHAWTPATGISNTSILTPTITPTATTTYLLTTTMTGSACPAAKHSLTLTIPPKPTVTASGSATICSGGTVTLTASSGTNYKWLKDGAVISSATSSTYGATATGQYQVVATNVNNCTDTSLAFAVAVVTVPATPTTPTGPTAVCSGVAQTWNTTAVPTATSYVWTMPSGWTGSSTTTSFGSTPTATGGTITVAASNNCGTSPAASIAVTSASTPAVPSAPTGTAAVCLGVATTYSTGSVTGAATYNWTLPSGWSGSSSTNSISATPSATGGNITVSATNYCGTSSASAALAVTSSQTPATPGTISGATAACSAVAQTYSVAAVPGAASYTWTLPSGWTGSSTTNSIAAMPNATGGNITVTATNYCGTSAASTKAVTSSAVPATPAAISGLTPICGGTSNTYSITAVPNATGYVWTMPTGWSGTSTSISMNATAGTGSGNITVTATNYCGSSTAQTLAVSVVNPPIQPGAITGTVNVCNGTSQTYSVTAVPSAASYTWTVPSGWSGTSTTNSLSATTGPNGGNVTVTATNQCGTSPAQSLAVTSMSIPVQPGIISGNAAICAGTTQSYAVAAVPAAQAYQWTLPATWGGSSSGTTINSIGGTASGTISVSAVNLCGVSPSRTLAVAVTNIPAQPAAISGTTTLCYGGSQTYSIPAVTGATSYSWIVPSGWTGGPSTTTSISLSANNSPGGTISVAAINGCGVSPARTQSVTAMPYPTVSLAPGGPVDLCVGDTVHVSAIGSSLSQWQWSYNGVPMQGATDSAFGVYAFGTYRVIAANLNGCADTAEMSVTATLNLPALVNLTVSPGVNVSPGTQVTFTATPTNEGTAPQYVWYRNGNIVTGVTGPVWNTNTISEADEVWVWLKSNRRCTAPDTARSIGLKMHITTGVVRTSTTEGTIRMYPNPTSGRITIEAKGWGTASAQKQVTAQVLDATGRIVYRAVAQRSGGDWQLDIDLDDDVANGMYVVRVSDGTNLAVQQIMVN